MDQSASILTLFRQVPVTASPAASAATVGGRTVGPDSGVASATSFAIWASLTAVGAEPPGVSTSDSLSVGGMRVGCL